MAPPYNRRTITLAIYTCNTMRDYSCDYTLASAQDGNNVMLCTAHMPRPTRHTKLNVYWSTKPRKDHA